MFECLENIFNKVIFSALGHDKHSNTRSNSSNNARDNKLSSRQSDKREYWGSCSSSNSTSNNIISGGSGGGCSGGGGSGVGISREELTLREREKERERERERERDRERERERERDRESNRDDIGLERQAQDMDISPGDSTPTSETLITSVHDLLPQGPVLLATALPRLASHTPSTPQTPGKIVSSPTLTQQTSNNSTSGPPVTLANLPRLLSQITGSKDQTDITPQKALQTIQTAIFLSRQVRLFVYYYFIYKLLFIAKMIIRIISQLIKYFSSLAAVVVNGHAVIVT